MKQFKSFAKSLKEKASNSVKVKVKEVAEKNPEFDKLSSALKQKEAEARKLKQELDAISKERQELSLYKQATLKEKESFAIRDQIAKTAKKLNVRETAIGDVMDLLEKDFKLQDGKIFIESGVEGEVVDSEQYIGQWLQTKEHFIQPVAAQSAKITPTPQGPLPAKKQEADSASLAGSLNSLLGLKQTTKR